MKTPKTFNEQVQKLYSHGFIIDDPNHVEDYLSKVNYYRLRGYWLSFEKDGEILPGTHFEDVILCYEMDRALRNWLNKAIEPLEIKLRTQFAYNLAFATKDSLAYKNKDLFVNKEAHANSLSRIEKEVERALNNNVQFVIHNLDKYGALPIWAVVELTSFGTVSKMFGNLREDYKSLISKSFNLNNFYCDKWFAHLTAVRNICAHHNRFYNRYMLRSPRLFVREKRYMSRKQFPTFLVLKNLYAYDDIQWNKLIDDLKEIINKFESVSLVPMAFPDDWLKILKQ